MTKMRWEDVQAIIKSPNNKNDVYLLFFTLEDDQMCKIMRNNIYQVEEYFSKRYDFHIIEIDAKESNLYLEPNTKYQVLEVPTFCIMKNNHINNIGHNFYPKEILMDWILELLD